MQNSPDHGYHDVVLRQSSSLRRMSVHLQLLTTKGGGLWQPDAQSLGKLRREIDRRSTRIKQVLMNERIGKEFLGGVSASEKKAVKAFIGLTSNASTALKRHPKVRSFSFSARSLSHPHPNQGYARRKTVCASEFRPSPLVAL